MGLGLHHRLRVLLGDPAVGRDMVTLYTCKRTIHRNHGIESVSL